MALTKKDDLPTPKVVDINEARFRANKGPPQQIATKNEVILRLSKIAKMKEGQSDLLQIPDKLFVTSPDSFSSDPALEISSLSSSLFRSSPPPANLPDYGIDIFSHGSNAFCTIVDKKRKIIVFEVISNYYVKEGGSWDKFITSLNEALANVAKIQLDGKQFNFIVCKEGAITTL